MINNSLVVDSFVAVHLLYTHRRLYHSLKSLIQKITFTRLTSLVLTIFILFQKDIKMKNHTYQELLQQAKELDATKKDFNATLNDLRFFGLCAFTDFQNESYMIERHAFNQLIHRLLDTHQRVNNKRVLVPISNSVINHMWNFPMLGTQIYNWHLNNKDDEDRNEMFLLRTDKNNIRAVLSTQYGAIWNSCLLESLYISHSLFNSEWRIPKYTLNRDELRLYTLFNEYDVNNRKYGSGLYVSNDEIGKHSLRFGTVLKRTSCDNSIIVNNIYYRLRHRANIFARLETIYLEIAQALSQSEQLLYKFESLQNVHFTDALFEHKINDIVNKFQLTASQKVELILGTENQTTLYGLINGITHASKFMKDEQVTEDMQIFAGNLLMEAKV